MISDYELKLMQCPDCKKVMKLSVFKGESIRYTWCMTCRYAVIWEAVEDD